MASRRGCTHGCRAQPYSTHRGACDHCSHAAEQSLRSNYASRTAARRLAPTNSTNAAKATLEAFQNMSLLMDWGLHIVDCDKFMAVFSDDHEEVCSQLAQILRSETLPDDRELTDTEASSMADTGSEPDLELCEETPTRSASDTQYVRRDSFGSSASRGGLPQAGVWKCKCFGRNSAQAHAIAEECLEHVAEVLVTVLFEASSNNLLKPGQVRVSLPTGKALTGCKGKFVGVPEGRKTSVCVEVEATVDFSMRHTVSVIMSKDGKVKSVRRRQVVSVV